MASIPQMGCHLVLDFHNTKVDVNDYQELNSTFSRIIKESGATIESHVYKKFEPQGLSILYLLSESHFSIHTWPEHGACAIDFYHCGETARLRMMKAEVLLCEYFGWENCTGSMIIDRGTYNYALIGQDDHTSILFKYHKLVERQSSSFGETRIYNNDALGKLLSVDGLIQFGFHNIKCFGDLFENKEFDNYFSNDPCRLKESNKTKENVNVLIIGAGDLSFPQEMIKQNLANSITIFDTHDKTADQVQMICDLNSDIALSLKCGKIKIETVESNINSNKYDGIVVVDGKLRPSKIRSMMSLDAYYAEVITHHKEFKEVCSLEGFTKITFHEISNTIKRFLIGKARYS